MLKLKLFYAVRFVVIIITVSCTAFVFYPLCAQGVSAKAYALIEQSSGRLICGKNQNTRLPMASTTKIMTALIAVESGKLSETFTVPAEALKVEGSSMGLAAGEKITLRELVYGLMLESGNDAANSIAIILGGSNDRFAEMMNARAGRLGLTNTHFCNPSGLDSKNHYTSALDLARLSAYAMKNAEFSKIVSTKKIRVSYNGIKNGRILCNHNRMLSCYSGALGVKTGFTKKCGRCLVSCAERDSVELVAVTLNDHDDWKDHKALLDSGFKVLKATAIAGLTRKFTANVVGGVRGTVSTYYERTVTASLKTGETKKVKPYVELDNFYYAPIKKGQTLGRIVYKVGGEPVAVADIKASFNVAKKAVKRPPDFLRKLWRNILLVFSKLCY